MSNEVEAAAALSLGGFVRRGKSKHTLPVGTPCPNCGVKLEGPWCYACGQLGEDFHRSALKLVLEAVYETFDLDGRIWRTLPDLLVRPGRLTRAYLDGHRVPQIPPLRLFLVALVLVFLVGINRPGTIPANFPVSNPAEAINKIQGMKEMSPEDKRETINDIKQAQAEIAAEEAKNPSAKTGSSRKLGWAQWLRAHIVNAVAHQDAFWQALQTWAERLAVLMLPIAAVLLSILFVFQRRFFLFDHIVFSMHSLTFLFLTIAAVLWLERYVGFGGWLFALPPVHLFAHMRGVYATSIFGTLLRMTFLFVGSVIGFACLLIGLFWIALSAM